MCLSAQVDVATLHTPRTEPLPRKAMEHVTCRGGPDGSGEVCGCGGMAISEVAKVPSYFDDGNKTGSRWF